MGPSSAAPSQRTTARVISGRPEQSGDRGSVLHGLPFSVLSQYIHRGAMATDTSVQSFDRNLPGDSLNTRRQLTGSDNGGTSRLRGRPFGLSRPTRAWIGENHTNNEKLMLYRGNCMSSRIPDHHIGSLPEAVHQEATD